MNRRRLLQGAAAAIFAAPLAAGAQQAGRSYRVVVLYGGPLEQELISRVLNALETRLRDLGWVNGRNIRLEHRGTDGTPGQFRDAVAEAVALRPDLIVVWSTVGGVAIKQATTTLPVVFLSVGVPVGIGLVASLSRPGGNMTGVTFEAASETYPKRLQLLKEVVPRLTRVAILYAVGDQNVEPAIRTSEAAAPSLGIRLHLVGVRDAGELDSAFSDIKSGAAQAVLVVAGALTSTNSQRIAELAITSRIPSVHAFRHTVALGGLMSLGPDLVEIARQGATYVDKILKGAKPADLPIEQPTKFELIINLKTARALGLTIPPSLLARADQVIE
jgi:putative tryptophan/tyrosine transport system substrate-binding protein